MSQEIKTITAEEAASLRGLVLNPVYEDVFLPPPGIRYFILMGGRAAGRSYAASQFALGKVRSPDYFRCAIMRYVLGDIRNSIFKEITDRAEEQGVIDELDVAEIALKIKHENNQITGIGFKKSRNDLTAKLKSLAGYNCVIIEEADEIDEDSFMQLDDTLRTVKGDIMVIMLLNPPEKNHWIIKRFFNLAPALDDFGIPVEGFYMAELKDSCKNNTVHIHTTYFDNYDNISESTKQNYENYRTTKPDHYWNMIRGLVSSGKRGLIFPNAKPISAKEYENLPYVPYYGLDFGFTNDPTALIGIKEHNKKLYLRGLLYQTGLTNQMISRKLGELGVLKTREIIGDSAEPKSIAEIAKDGWNIRGSIKGQDSVNAGIGVMQDYEIYYVDDDKNLADEFLNWVWALDRNKEPTNDPVDEFNHYMDAARGAVFTKHSGPYIGF